MSLSEFRMLYNLLQRKFIKSIEIKHIFIRMLHNELRCKSNNIFYEGNNTHDMYKLDRSFITSNFIVRCHHKRGTRTHYVVTLEEKIYPPCIRQIYMTFWNTYYYAHDNRRGISYI